MRALVSGQAGFAVLIQDGRYVCLDIDGGQREVKDRSVAYLFDGATDVEEIESTDRGRVSTELDRAWRGQRCLLLCLLLLDRDGDDETRREAAGDTEFFLEDPAIHDFLSARMFAAPLPDAADLVGAIVRASAVKAERVAVLLEEVGVKQTEIERVRSAWDELPEHLFDSTEVKADFAYAMVNAGVFRDLTRTDPAKRNEYLFKLLETRRWHRYPAWRKALPAWIKPLATALPQELFVEEEEQIEESDRRRARRPRTGGAGVLPVVERQKDAIKSHLDRGEIRVALEYTDALVAYQAGNSRPEHVAKSLCDLAQRAKKLGRYDIQYELAKRAVATAPEDGWSYAQLGDACRLCGRMQEALDYYRFAGEFGEVRVARNGKAEVLRTQGRLQEAFAEYESTVHDFPGDVVARNGKAEVLKAQGRLVEALAEYESVVRDFPGDAVTRTGKAEVLKAQGRLDEALAEYEFAVRDFPGNVVARNGKAEVLKAQGRLDEALAEYEFAVRDFPGDVVARNGKAEVLKAQGRLDEALAEYEFAVRDFPGDVVARNGKAEVLKAQGRLDEALAEYEFAVRDFPGNVVARNGKAEVLKAQGQLDEALAEYEFAVRDFPGDVVARNGKAEVLKAQGRLDEALAEYEFAVRDFPGNVVARNGKAEVLKAQGRLDEALAEYEFAVRDFPGDVVARTGKAEVLKAQGRLREAHSTYEQTLEAFPFNRAARSGLGGILLVTGRVSEALRLITVGNPQSLDDWIDQHIRGMALLKQGKVKEAHGIFEHGSRSNPFAQCRAYFRAALAYTRRTEEPIAALEWIKDEHALAFDILRLDIYGRLQEIDGARRAYQAVSYYQGPRVVELREDLAARARLIPGPPKHSDGWVAEREFELLLAA